LVTAEWDQQNQLRDQLVQLANQHRQAHDYVAVVKELEKIPAPLRSGNPIAEQLSIAQSARDELSSLLQQMGSDIKNKRFDGLLEKTTRVLELNPKHDQVQKLREQLLERQQQAEDQAAELLGRAEQQYSQYEDEAVLKTVANWPPALQQPARVEQLHNLATDRLACVQELEAQISAATKTAENQRHVEKILLKKTTRFLQLCPGHPKIEKLREQLLQRQQQADDQAAELLGRAEQHYSYYEDEAVLKTVANWPPALQQPARVEQLEKMATDRLGRVQQLKKQIATTTIADRKLSLVEEYILLRPGDRQAGKIAEGLRQQIQQEKHRQRQAEWNRQQKQEEMKRQQTRKMIITGSALAAVLLILMTGLWIRSGIKERAAAARADSVILLWMADIKAEADRLAADRLAADKAAAETTAAVKKQMTPAQLALGDPVVNSVGMLLVPIPAGEFPMGSPDGGSSERPQHLVKITKPFYLGLYEVTQQQYEKVKGGRPWQGKLFVKEGADYPAVYVSHDDAVEFCRRLSEQEGVEYRLPTEAEWEYACRAGTTTAYSFGDNEAKLGQYAWYEKNAGDIGEEYAHRVGQKLPNPWGLYDMHGNVWEWCQDWYAPYGSEKVVSDPLGPAQGDYRVVRGGSFNYRTSSVRSANRFNLPPGFPNDNLGFRAARTYHLSP
jgi:formylglycine-generating enzyme required for sulfatase activity